MKKQRKMRELSRVRQFASESVFHYATRVNQYYLIPTLDLDSRRRAFVAGLSPAIAHHVIVKHPDSLNAAIKAAGEMEVALQAAQSRAPDRSAANRPGNSRYNTSSSSS